MSEQPKQQTNQRTYQQVKADLDRAKKELENAKDAISRGSAKSLVDYYEQELKRLPKPRCKARYQIFQLDQHHNNSQECMGTHRDDSC